MPESTNNLSSMIMSSYFRGFLIALKVLWPLIALIVLALIVNILFKLWEMSRISKSGLKDIDKMDGLTFEKYLQTLFKRLGYKVERTTYIGDYGADLIVSKDGVRSVIQAKRYKNKVNIKAIQEVVAAKAKYNCTEAIVVTTSYFTKAAIDLAKANKVILWDRNKLVNILVSVQNKGRDELIKDESTVVTEEDKEESNFCAICGKPVSEKVKQYCLSDPEKFGGKVYCYEHQKIIKYEHQKIIKARRM